MKNKFSDEDIAFMDRAIHLARKAQRISPNPRVGAVIVKNKVILAEAYHQGPGKAHAEAAALQKLKGKAKGATLYVTLEPCCHTDKRTPPCLDAIVKSGVKGLTGQFGFGDGGADGGGEAARAIDGVAEDG